MSAKLRFGEPVRQALTDGDPVVALESTVIAHGLPYPQNVETALAIEDAVRAAGAVPATIGVADGELLVGTDRDEIERFGSAPGVRKITTRDIAPTLAAGELGATTVASTLAIAEMAGIPVFSTAGVGGVHRRAAETFDISADLTQFARSRVAVVCAGAKSILDLRLTLEYLETAGVPVIGYETDDFPAFYVRSSGLPVPRRIDDLDVVARSLDAHWSLPDTGSVLVTAPIREADALDGIEIEAVIETALAAADADGVSGPAITPYLMKAVSRATDGRSAAANRSVLISTAYLAGQVAAAYANAHRSELAGV